MEQMKHLELKHKNPMGVLDFSLLNDYQRDFPLVAQPFAEIGQRLGVDETIVISAFGSLHQRGLTSRIGAVFRPNVVGVSALAALAVPAARLEQVAACVSALPEVNHNYAREHHFNLWFVVTASSAQVLSHTFQKIEAACDCGTVLILPLLEQFHIDLGFGLASSSSHFFQSRTRTPHKVAAIALAPQERTFMATLQAGLPLVPRPYGALGWDEDDALALLSRWTEDGVINRFGVVVRHHELGFTANAMVVWDVPDAEVSQVGRRIAQSDRVSLCYRRPRHLPHWPYNLFCMIHGRDRQEVEQRIAALVRVCDMGAYPSSTLFSSHRFKQCGARYVEVNAIEAVPELTSGSD